MSDPNLPDSSAALQALGDGAGFVDRILDSIEHIRLFEDFGRDEIEVLARYLKSYRAAAGTEIIREGEAGDFMLLLIEGSMEILKLDPRGLPQRLAVAGPGKTLGEMSLIDGEHRFASCVAHEPVRFAVLTRADLNEMLFAHPRLGNKLLIWILQITIGRVREMDLRSMPQAAGPLA